MRYFVYDLTGRILRVGDCAEQDVQLQAGPGQFVELGQVDDALQYMDVTTTPHQLSSRKTYTLDTLPIPVNMIIDKERIRNETSEALSFPVPGIYSIVIIPDDPSFQELRFNHEVI